MRFGREPALVIHARALGCKRPPPLTGLCVGCPFEKVCPVPRAPLMLWTARINLEQGKAKPFFYLNSLTSSDIGTLERKLVDADTVSYRTTSIQIRAGDILTSDQITERNHILHPTVNLFEMLDPDRYEAEKLPTVVMDANQVRYNQLSNFGRRAVLAVQVKNFEQAGLLSTLINEHWHEVMLLLRKIRPLKPSQRVILEKDFRDPDD